MKNDHPLCGLCHRKLRSMKSREVGYGPKCKKKHDHEQEMLRKAREANEGEN